MASFADAQPQVGGDLVLASGGLDSTVCLALAIRDAPLRGTPMPVAVTFDYNQRHRVEIDRAARICQRLGVEHLIAHIGLDAWGGSALTDPATEVPAASSDGEIPITYVPARNLVFLAVAVSIAEARDVDRIHIGVNDVDYSGYPDCRPDFLEAFRVVARLGTKRGVEGRPFEIRAPLASMSKAEIVRAGVQAQAPLELTWSCYRGGDRPCGACDSCAIRAKGFAAAGLPDPALIG